MKLESMILREVSKIVFVLLNILALYLFLKGHNEPGGGFIAGIATAVSIVILALVMGVRTVSTYLNCRPETLAFVGLVFAYGTFVAPAFFDLPFLFQKMVHLHIPILGDIHVGTPMIFDLGVYLVVVGVTSRMIMAFEEVQ